MFKKFLKVSAVLNETAERIKETDIGWQLFLERRDRTMLQIFTEFLGFSYEFVLAPEQEIGWRLPNGSWTGVLGMLQRREVDMVVSPVIIDEEINEDFCLSYPHIAYETTFLTKKHEPVPVMGYFLHPFSIQVWLAIVACVFLVPFLINNLMRRKQTIVSVFTWTLSSLVGQGIRIIPQRCRDYFVLASWILGSAFLYHFYAAVLLSCLTFPPLQGIGTIDDLGKAIKEGTYECSTYPDKYPIPRYLKQSENPTVKAIVNSLNRYRTDGPVEYMVTSAVEKKPAFVAVRQDLTHWKDVYFVSEENFFVVNAAYAANKDFCGGASLDKVVHRAWAAGILTKIYDDSIYYYFRKDRELYGKQLENPPDENKLTMTQLKGPFIFLIASLSLAFVVFLIEVYCEKYKRLECFKNLNSKKKKSFARTAVPRDEVLHAKGKIRGPQGKRASKRKKGRFKNSLSIAIPIANFQHP